MRGTTNIEKIHYWLTADRIPVVKLLIVANVFTFLLLHLFNAGFLSQLLSFRPATFFVMPWTALTYPLMGAYGVISLLFSGYWLWVAGGNLERAWNSRTFGVFFFAMAAISALGLYIGSLLTGVPVSVNGLWLPLAATTVAFGMLNPERQILFMFVIPLKLKYLALLSAALVFISYGSAHLVLGLFALAGCAVSYWYVRSGREIDFPRVRDNDRGKVIHIQPRHPRPRRSLNPAEWYRGYREKKRLKDLFDKSGFEE